MAQNVTIAGNQYPDVPSILVPKTGGGGNAIFADPSVVTAVAADVASGKYFLDSSGVLTQGTASGGGGSSSWTKVAETSYQITFTGTSSTTHATWATGHNELWTPNKWVYVRIRDSAGKRNEYFYGTDQFFYNVNLVNGTGWTNITTALRNTIRVSSNEYNAYLTSNTTGYGVWADTLYSDGNIRIRTRYSSTYSLTIDGTYKVEVYLLDPPTGAPIFT